MKKRTHPKFLRPNYGRSSRSRIGIAWRRPRGIDNKKRAKIKYMGASPSIGYGQPSAIRDFHPKGLPEKLVNNVAELAGLKNILIRIAAGVGNKKAEQIQKSADAAGLTVVNKRKVRPKAVKSSKDKKGKEVKKETVKQEKAKIPA
jgi:large subunit ribosomal protein L32e